MSGNSLMQKSIIDINEKRHSVASYLGILGIWLFISELIGGTLVNRLILIIGGIDCYFTTIYS